MHPAQSIQVRQRERKPPALGAPGRIVGQRGMNTRNLLPDLAPFNACVRPSIPEGTMTEIEQNRLTVLLACLWARISSRSHAGLMGRVGAASRPATTKYIRDGGGDATHVVTTFNFQGRRATP